MKFEDAMKHLRKGKHIYRMEHVQVANFDGSMLYVECFRLAGIGREFVVRAVFHWDNTLTTGDYTEDKYPFSASDILAEDWGVLEDTKQLLLMKGGRKDASA